MGGQDLRLQIPSINANSGPSTRLTLLTSQSTNMRNLKNVHASADASAIPALHRGQPTNTASQEFHASSPTALSLAIDEAPETMLNGADAPEAKLKQNRQIHKNLRYMNRNMKRNI